MAGITPQISTSSFKPLSLQEIMMVPLAKQKQEDDAIMALDEFDSLSSQSLDVDKDYVSEQIEGFRNESSKLSEKILESGVDRSLINQVRNLRNKKNRELSLEGGIGKAKAAFEQYQLNRKNIQNRKDLTDQQKILGLQRAAENYTGVMEGGVYEDYQGASYVDVMKRGREIVKQMTPQEKAKLLNMKANADGTYTEGNYIHESLTPEHIQKVVMQALEGDQAAMNYVNEMESLGIGNAKGMLEAAAVSAGNVGQVDIQKNVRPLPTSSTSSLNDKDYGINPEGWRVAKLYSGEVNYNRSLNLDPDFEEEVGFNPDGSLSFNKFEGNKTYTTSSGTTIWGTPVGEVEMDTPEYSKWKESFGRSEQIKTDIDKLRKDNPNAFENKSDKEVYHAFLDAKKKAIGGFTTVVNPLNDKNTFYNQGKRIFGTKESPGEFITTKSLKIMGETPIGGVVNSATVASQLGYNDVDELAEAMANGRELGLAIADPDFPMGRTIQVRAKDGTYKTLVASPDDNIKQKYPDARILSANLGSGKPYEVRPARFKNKTTGKLEEGFKYYINRMNPRAVQNPETGKWEARYEPVMLSSTTEYTKAEIDSMTYDVNTGQMYIGDKPVTDIRRYSYNDVINNTKNAVLNFYNAQKQQY